MDPARKRFSGFKRIKGKREGKLRKMGRYSEISSRGFNRKLRTPSIPEIPAQNWEHNIFRK